MSDRPAAPETEPAAPNPIEPKPVETAPAGPVDDEPAHRLVARTTLPTDVRLVGGSKPGLSDTQPDGIRIPDTKPDGIPLVSRTNGAADAGDEEDDAYADERAEDPDAGDDSTGVRWDDVEATPPSSKFRSGPTPPRG
jgi:hypothetical protein